MEKSFDPTKPRLRKPEGACVICKAPIQGWGHNAVPLAKGRCCDDCNFKVIDARILALKEMHARGEIQ